MHIIRKGPLATLETIILQNASLNVSQVSPMMEAFVNTDEPLATDVDVDTYLFAQPAVSVDFENVPIEKMVDIEAKFRDGIQCCREIHAKNVKFHNSGLFNT